MLISHGVASLGSTSGIPITSLLQLLQYDILRPKLTTLRETYSQRLTTAASTILNAHEVPKQDTALIIERGSNLFSDSDVWPSRRTAFYLGILPCLVRTTSSPHWLCHALTTGPGSSVSNPLIFSSSCTQLCHPPTRATHTLFATNRASTVHSSYYDATVSHVAYMLLISPAMRCEMYKPLAHYPLPANPWALTRHHSRAFTWP